MKQLANSSIIYTNLHIERGRCKSAESSGVEFGVKIRLANWK